MCKLDHSWNIIKTFNDRDIMIGTRSIVAMEQLDELARKRLSKKEHLFQVGAPWHEKSRREARIALPGRPSEFYLALMVTVNELFAGLVSVPLNSADPVTGIVPAAATFTFTTTVIVWPPPIVDALHVMVPEEPGAGP